MTGNLNCLPVHSVLEVYSIEIRNKSKYSELKSFTIEFDIMDISKLIGKRNKTICHSLPSTNKYSLK